MHKGILTSSLTTSWPCAQLTGEAAPTLSFNDGSGGDVYYDKQKEEK